MKNRRKHSAEFKARVALEAAREQKTIAELTREYGVHANQITKWKRQLLEGAEEVFTRDGGQQDRNQEQREAVLYEQIGKLQVQLEWLKKKTGM